jgi:N-acyl-D-aspartate/D-glutamate deacylase
MIRLASQLEDFGGTMLELIPTIKPYFTEEAIDLMSGMSVAAGRPLNWNELGIGSAIDEDSVEQRLSASDRAESLGGQIIALTQPGPSQLRLCLLSTVVYNSFPEWSSVLSLPMEDRLRALVNRTIRAAMAESVSRSEGRAFVQFDAMTVDSVVDSSLKVFVGRTLGDIAEERGCTALDAMLDIAVADRLGATFLTPPDGDDDASWRRRAELWSDPRAVIGGSDAGAHLDMLAMFGYFTDLIGPTVRNRQLLTLTEAVRLVTDVPARMYGLRGRGRVKEGWCADIVVFDPERVNSEPVTMRADMPGGYSRLYAEAEGIEHVLVNGDEILAKGDLTGAQPGCVLRSGRDTG